MIFAVFVTRGRTGAKATGQIPPNIWLTTVTGCILAIPNQIGTVVMGCIPTIPAVFVTGSRTGAKVAVVVVGAHNHLEALHLEVKLEAAAVEVIEVVEAVHLSSSHIVVAVGMLGAVHLKVKLEVAAVEVVEVIEAVRLSSSHIVVAVGMPNLLIMRFMESDKAPRREKIRLEN